VCYNGSLAGASESKVASMGFTTNKRVWLAEKVSQFEVRRFDATL